VCQATQTAFSDLSTTGTGSITGWSWDFTNDGTADNLTQNPGFTYLASGTFTTSLQVTASTGCTNTFTLPVNVWGHSIPNFSPDNVCHGVATSFTNTTNTTTNLNIGGTPSYNWTFDDGSPVSNVANPVQNYTLGANGNAAYNVTLTATSTHGCVDFVIKPVNVYSTPTASFTSNVVCHGTPTQFNNAGNGNGNTINGFMWDFESNGTVDVTGVSNPNFTFPNFGTNLVSYTVSTTPIPGLTCANSNTVLTAYVNPNPVPDFTFVNKCINTQPNSMDASGSTIGVGTNTNYAWAMGDGTTANGLTSTHTYATPAAYNVTLTVTSNMGCVKSIVKQVEVYKKPAMDIVFKNACHGSAVTFTAVERPGSGTATDWYWDFNSNINTIEASGQTTSFIYPAAGQHTIGLVTVSNPGQCRDTVIVRNVYVNYIPQPAFTPDDADGCSVHCVKFTDASTLTLPAKITNWTWTLGDGSTPVSASSNASQNTCYKNLTGNQLAHYDVKLEVTSDSGCTNSKEYKSLITVYPMPTANYVINPDPGNVVTPLEYFTNQSMNYTRWYWTFGDGGYKTDSLNASPTHFYNSETANTYYTNLIVINEYGCSDTAMVPIEIGPEFAFYVPNAFTPFGSDGINDQFTGIGIGISKYDMWIYDRWGEMLYYSNDIKLGWDGKRQGKSQEVKQEVFVYKIKVLDVLGKAHNYVGHVTLLR
jgi:gliding motility-associated-like protein